MERLIKEIKVCLILAIRDEFYTFDLIEIHVKEIPRKINFDFEFQNFFPSFALYSTRREGKTLPRNHRSQS